MSQCSQPPRALVEHLVAGPGLAYVLWPAIVGYLRTVTHPTILGSPLSVDEAMANVDAVLARSHVRVAGEGDDFWASFRSVAADVRPRGSLVPDAHLVALMREQGTSASSGASPRRTRSTTGTPWGSDSGPAGVPACDVPTRPEPDDDPVLARRARIGRLVALGQRIGYSLWSVAVVVFVVGAVTGFRPAMVTVVIGGLAVGSALLAPSIVISYGVRAADREDRQGRGGGHG